MMRKIVCLFVAAVFLMTTGLVWAQGKSSAAQAKITVDKAAAFYKEKGKKAAIAEFNNPKGQFVKGDLYVYVWSKEGVVLAHPVNKAIVGKNTQNLADEDGKFFRKDAVNLANTKGSGWVDYKYKNPKTSKIEQKTTYVKKVDDVILACGAYK